MSEVWVRSGLRWTRPRPQWWPAGSPSERGAAGQRGRARRWPAGSPSERGAAGEGGARWPVGPLAEVTGQIVAVKTQPIHSAETVKDRAPTGATLLPTPFPHPRTLRRKASTFARRGERSGEEGGPGGVELL